MNKGDAVTVTVNAGVICGENGSRFIGQVADGVAGTYAGEHPNPELNGQDWHLVRVDADVVDLDAGAHELYTEQALTDELFAPLHSTQFEGVSA